MFPVLEEPGQGGAGSEEIHRACAVVCSIRAKKISGCMRTNTKILLVAPCPNIVSHNMGFGPQPAAHEPKAPSTAPVGPDDPPDASLEDSIPKAEPAGAIQDEKGGAEDPQIRSAQPLSTMSGFPNVVESNADGSDMAEAPFRLSYARALNKIQVKQDPGQTRTTINKIPAKQEPKAEKKPTNSRRLFVKILSPRKTVC